MNDKKEVQIDEKLNLNPDNTPVAANIKVATINQLQTPAQILEFAGLLIKGKLIPDTWRKPEEVLTIIEYGRELGIEGVVALHNFYIVQGRIGMQGYLVAGLLKKHNIRYELVEDWKVIGEGEEQDCYTSFKFSEYYQGKWFENTIKLHWSECVNAGWVNTKSHSWNKMPKIMLRLRALTVGAKIACPEGMMGIQTVDELFDKEGIAYDISEDFKATRR